MRKKKIALFSITVACVFLLCACSFPFPFPRAEQLTELMDEEGKLIEEESDEVIRCLTEGDKYGFLNLFCEEVRKSETFQQELDEVFNFFICDVYIRAEVEPSAGGEGSTEAGERIKWSLSPEITYIEVLQDVGDSGDTADRYYQVRYNWQVMDKEHPEREGIRYMEISLLNMDQVVTIGSRE